MYTAAPGKPNMLHVGGDDSRDGEVLFHEESIAIDATGTACFREAWDGPETVRCPPLGGARVALGDGDDRLYLRDPFPAGWTLSGDGGPGNDELRPSTLGFPVTFAGGDGDDTLDGGDGADTLDGVANDGHSGEHDNVIAVEHIKVTRPGRFVAGADAMVIDVWNIGAGNSTVTGSPGADDIRTWDLNDTIDGGAGNDAIEGGNGNDTITGGPGRDQINADASADSCNFLVCRLPHGNDVVHARDGEADSIECGDGADRVIADGHDTVAPSCETVERGAAPGPGGTPGGQGCTVPQVKRGTKAAKARRKLRRAGCATRTRKARSRVRRGRVVRVAPKPGRPVAAGKKVTVYVSKGR